MSRSCTICRHDAKEDINRALLDSEPFRHIAARTGTSTTALQRHKADHLPVALAQAVVAKATGRWHSPGAVTRVASPGIVDTCQG